MSEDPKARSREWYAAINSGGLVDRAHEFLTDDFVDHNAAPGTSPGLEGVRETFREFYAAFPDMKVNVLDQIAEGDKVVTRATIKGTQTGKFMGAPATGRSFEVDLIDIGRFDGDKFERAAHVTSMEKRSVSIRICDPSSRRLLPSSSTSAVSASTVPRPCS